MLLNDIKINMKRLEENLQALSRIGRNVAGGIDRALGSEADRMARRWLIDYWEEQLGKPVRIDAIANMWVRREGKENLPPIVIGSHHDAVPNGGMYDGALGVLVATEIMQQLKEQQIETRHPIEVVSFTGEEPNPFNVSTLGSKVLSGRLKKEDLLALKNREDGSSLQECILQIGGDITKADEAFIKPNDIRAFIECHIEQGRRLFDRRKAVATVSQIIGIYRENVEIIGEANHAGTTVMKDRHDALIAASEFCLAFEKLIKDRNDEALVGTIGYLDVFPNSANIIPGNVSLTLEIRTCSPEVKESLVKEIAKVAYQIEGQRGVTIKRKVNLDQREMPMDQDVMKAVARGITAIGEEDIELISMAGHDAANMQRVTKSGMIFVQSIEGKSHCPEEKTNMGEIEKVASAMLKAVLILDKEMD